VGDAAKKHPVLAPPFKFSVGQEVIVRGGPGKILAIENVDGAPRYVVGVSAQLVCGEGELK